MLSHPAVAMQPPPPFTVVFDAEALGRLRELDPRGENRLIERVMSAFRSSSGRLLLQLDAATAQNPVDAAAVRHVTHTLKSASASIGALELSRRCAAIEADAREGRTAQLAADCTVLRVELAAVLMALPGLPE